MKRLIAIALFCAVAVGSAQSPSVLDHDLADYNWVIRHDAAIDAAIVEWYITYTGERDMARSAVEHALRRAGWERTRWQIELGEPLTLRKILEDIWSSSGAPPDPEPDPEPDPDSADDIDASTVTWIHANMSDWAVSSTVTSTKITGGTICVEHTMAGQWPVEGGAGTALGGVRADGNPWIFANIGGRWYGATYEWLRPGQTCKGGPPDFITAENIGLYTRGHARPNHPMITWVPKSGELVGLAMSTFARSNFRTTNERTNIVLVPWP